MIFNPGTGENRLLILEHKPDSEDKLNIFNQKKKWKRQKIIKGFC